MSESAKMAPRTLSFLIRSKLKYTSLQNEYCLDGPNGLLHSNGKIVTALYSFQPNQSSMYDQLSFDKGDKLVVTDDSDADWWLAYRLKDSRKKVGFVPKNFVISYSLDMEEWYFGDISRRMSESLLLQSYSLPGMFLVRKSEQIQGFYSLSIRDFDLFKYDHVKHYKIGVNHNGKYYITPTKCFTMLHELIEFYSAGANGLCRRLTRPCPRTPETSTNIQMRHSYMDCWDQNIDTVDVNVLAQNGPLISFD